MDKYSVDQTVDSEQLEKAASEGCPECGAKCAQHGSVLICPRHGTEPFNRKNGK